MRFHNKIPVRPAQFVLLADQLIIILGFLTALLAHYRLIQISEIPVHTFFYRGLIHIFFGIIAWAAFGINKKVIRFFNSKDYLSLILILLLIHILSATAGWVLPNKFQLRGEIFVFSFLVTSFYIITSRFIISYLYFHFKKSVKSLNARKLLIYGAGNQGLFLKEAIKNNYSEEYKLCAFIDDDKFRIGRSIEGLMVYDTNKDLYEVIRKYEITDIILSTNNIKPEYKSWMLEQTLGFNIRVKEFAGANSVFEKFNLDKLATLDINDLMNREAIHLYGDHISQELEEKTIMVTGAAGSIGCEIVRKLAAHKVSTIICVDFSESALYDLEQEMLRKFPELNLEIILADIRKEEIMDLLFNKYTPSIVYHTAAYKHVPLMEKYPWEAIHTNVFGTWNIAKMSIQYKVEKFVLISSDKAVNPTSIMGATKRLAEIIIQSLSSRNFTTSFVTTRFGNVLGSNGSVVPLFKKQIENGGPVTITHPEITRYFMTIPEACLLVLEASVMAKGGEIFVFDMGKAVKIRDLAINMIRLSGFIPEVDIKIEYIGLRPGEKLYEDLFSEKEKMKETYHEKIMISNENNHKTLSAEDIILKLEKLEHSYEPTLFRRLIKELVPEYISEHLDEESFIIKEAILENNS